MIQRKIEPEQVAETLEFPDNIVPGDQREQIAIKNYGNREIHVVFEEIDADTVMVFTVMKPRTRQ